ncbi:hypothetical protein CO230_00730 [Chryseobacterium sp. 6424]|uniref:hypothetical protein n=1 Tax=Chryseobacterium sp. 6424 TaxID=2039166 RepID=UPI000EFC976D|nr:hypothetical protein [Chryseobacterium sp. 6424]AYO56792.1 hypothetical protein CO230_00730 [Chryseobacterium sp. 6424]
MNFSAHLFNFLKKHGKVSVENFGIFYLKNTNAVVESTTNRILPPGKEVAFDPHPNIADDTFAHYLAQEKNIPVNDAQADIQQEVSYWNATIEKEGALSLEGLGTFRTDGSQPYFSGLRLENLAPDFYGLEEIKISDIKKSRAVPTEKKPYRFGRTLNWLLPLLMIVGVLGYFAATQPELIFGKKSLLKEKPAAPQPKKQTIIKKDTATVQVISDTLKTDTLAAVKTTSHTWKKLKKPQNR